MTATVGHEGRASLARSMCGMPEDNAVSPSDRTAVIVAVYPPFDVAQALK